MTVRWALVANSSFAQIFEIKGCGKEIIELQKIDHPDGRKKNGEILSDRPGRAFDSLGSSRHALGTEVDPHTHDQKVFIHHIGEILRKAKAEHHFDELALIAPPQFLGELNLILPELVKKAVTKEINKDLPLSMSNKERMDSLCKYLDLWNHKS